MEDRGAAGLNGISCHALVENAADAIAVHVDGRIVYANSAALHLFGAARREDLIGRAILDLVHPGSQLAAQARVEAMARGAERMPPILHRMVRLDGSEVDVEVTGARVDVGGRVGVQISARDVSDRTRIEAALQLTQFTLDHAAVPVGWIEADGRIAYANGAWRRLVGGDGELVGRRIWEVDGALTPERWDAQWRDLLRDGELRLPRTLHRPDGEERHEVLHLYDVRHGGRHVAVQIAFDVTAERHAIETARRAAATMRAAFDAFDDTALIIERDGTVLIANEACERRLGLASGALVGKRIFDLFRASIASGRRERCEEALRTGRTVRFADTSEGRDHLNVLSPVLDDAGQVVRLAILSIDVTERKAIEGALAEVRGLLEQAEEGLATKEAQLRQASKMEAVGQLAGGVAHDFNNLLTVILSYASFVKQAVRDPEVMADVDEIRRAAERAVRLTRQLLTFSRRSLIQPQVLHPGDVVGEMEKLLVRTLGERVRLELLVAPDLWPVRADAGELEQVLMNLAINGRDAMPAGGTLTIGLCNVALDGGVGALPPGEYTCLEIADTGEGMTPEVQERIFEPFFTTKPVGRGTGLGLATVFGIVQRAGGEVRVRSAPGRGSAFRVYLPRCREAPEEPRRDVEEGPGDGRGRCVLVVEDETAVRSMVSRVLAREGYQVIEAAGPGDALALWERHAAEVDLVLTDVIMPQMSGSALAATLRVQRPEQRVLFMSGHADEVTAPEGVLAPGVLLLQKPFSAEDLRRMVRTALAG